MYDAYTLRKRRVLPFILVPRRNLRSVCKVRNELGQLLSPLERDRVVRAGTNASNAAVALETSEAQRCGLLQEVGFSNVDIVTLCDSEADIHPGAGRLVGHYAVHARVSVQSVVDELCLLGGDGFLAAGFIGISGQKLLEDLAGDVDT